MDKIINSNYSVKRGTIIVMNKCSGLKSTGFSSDNESVLSSNKMKQVFRNLLGW